TASAAPRIPTTARVASRLRSTTPCTARAVAVRAWPATAGALAGVIGASCAVCTCGLFVALLTAGMATPLAYGLGAPWEAGQAIGAHCREFDPARELQPPDRRQPALDVIDAV